MDKLTQQLKPIVGLLVVCALLIGGVTWLTGEKTNTSEVPLTDVNKEIPAPLTPAALEAYDVDKTSNMNPIAVLKTDKGTIEIELFEDRMPITAGNFEKLAGQGFYDGIKFHRVIKDFMIQGGDPNTKTDNVLTYGTGGPGYSIPDEHVKSDLLTNVRGTISMANSGPDTGGSQFFINLVDNTGLDFDKEPSTSQHPVFGRVIAGMDVVDAIGQVKTNQRGLPDEPIVIESVTIRR
ncbi:MAG: Peptidyl-prolyl cis-trans isomerase-like 1 [Candidatus Parcubacteria bacterium]|jgi:peptidylprolyl isomerase